MALRSRRRSRRRRRQASECWRLLTRCDDRSSDVQRAGVPHGVCCKLRKLRWLIGRRHQWHAAGAQRSQWCRVGNCRLWRIAAVEYTFSRLHRQHTQGGLPASGLLPSHPLHTARTQYVPRCGPAGGSPHPQLLAAPSASAAGGSPGPPARSPPLPPPARGHRCGRRRLGGCGLPVHAGQRRRRRPGATRGGHRRRGPAAPQPSAGRPGAVRGAGTWPAGRAPVWRLLLLPSAAFTGIAPLTRSLPPPAQTMAAAAGRGAGRRARGGLLCHALYRGAAEGAAAGAGAAGGSQRSGGRNLRVCPASQPARRHEAGAGLSGRMPGHFAAASGHACRPATHTGLPSNLLGCRSWHGRRTLC